MSAVKFHDPNLQAAFDEHHGVIDEAVERIRRADADIRSLEALLSSSGIVFDCEVPVSLPDAVEYDVVPGELAVFSVGWFEHGHGRKRRICLKTVVPARFDCDDVTSITPIAGARPFCRLHAAGVLPELLLRIAAEADSKNPSPLRRGGAAA